MKLEYPIGLADAAKTLGVRLGTGVAIDERSALMHLHSHMGGDIFGAEDTFGFSLNPLKVFKPVKKKLAAKLNVKAQTTGGKEAAVNLNRAAVKPDLKKTAEGLKGAMKVIGPIAMFAIPGIGPIVGTAAFAAMASADKLLSDPKVTNAAAVIKNTQAMAALGDVAAQRGAAVLAATAKIRVAKKTPPGQPAIPVTTPAQKTAVAKAIPKTAVKKSPAEVKALATKKLIEAKSQGWFTKFLGWFGLKPK